MISSPLEPAGKTAIIGAGVMGETLIVGLVNAGFAPEHILVADRRVERCRDMQRLFDVTVAESISQCGDASTIVLAVKPQDIDGVIAELAPHMSSTTLVISIAAGVSLKQLQSHMPPGTPVVRVMPNTPAQVGEGMSAISAGEHASHDHLEHASSILSAVGKVMTVPETYLDAVTAISGSGPAYLFFVAEAMIDSGVMLGLPRDKATELVVQTMVGSANLLRDSHEHPTVLRERVMSPGGTTAAAVRSLEENGVRAAFIAAMAAARDRSVELGEAE